MKKTDFIKEIEKQLENSKNRSAWDKGINIYCFELLEHLENQDYNFSTLTEKSNFQKIVLNGAKNWFDYSWGGGSFIYDEDICKNLCPPSMQRKLKFGQYRPNKYEEWLDVQARALNQASVRLWRIIKTLQKTINYAGFAEVVESSEAETISKGA